MRHGGDLSEAASQHGRGDWLDLSTGINTHPWTPPAELAFKGWERLPSQADGDALIAAARPAYRVPDDLAVVAAPGTQALMQWLPRVATAGLVQILGPTYGGHQEAWRAGGFSVVPTTGSEVRPDARHLVVVNPNNPDGRILPIAEILRLAGIAGERGGWLVVDEAFADVDPGISVVPHATGLPIVVLRSFGKFYGLPGLRLGFAIGSHSLADALCRVLGDWPVSTPALLTGAAALADGAWAEATRRRLFAEATLLDATLRSAGLDPVGGTSLFRLVRHPNARAIHHALAEQGIWTRRFDWADDLLRIGLPPGDGARARLAAALM